MPSKPTPGTNLVVYAPNSGPKSPPNAPKAKHSSPLPQRLDSAEVQRGDGEPDWRPTKEDLQSHIRKMTAFMNVIAGAVQDCRLTRDQMDSGLKNMRQVLLTLQQEAIEEMRAESEQDGLSKVGGFGSLQLLRQN